MTNTSYKTKSIAPITRNAIDPAFDSSTKEAFPSPIVIVPPAKSGNIGDEAMICGIREGILQTIDGADRPRFAIANHGLRDGHQRLFGEGREYSSFRFSFPGSRDILPKRWIKSFWNAQARRAVRQAGSLFVIGADMLDGAYRPGASLALLDIADVAARAGIPSTITGFSYNQTPNRSCVEKLRSIAERVRLCVRDPKSYERVIERVGDNAIYVADVAFMLPADPNSSDAKAMIEWISERRAQGDFLLGLNLNPLLSTHFGMASFRELVALALEAVKRFSERIGPEQRVSIVGIPHDRRQKPSDHQLLMELERQLPLSTKNLEMKTLPETASAGAVKAVCGHLNLLLTGRMHAAIAALGQGTPVMPIDNQGKVRGLLDHFRIPELAVSRDLLNQPHELADRLEEAAGREMDLRQTIAERWPIVRALSMRNFDVNARGTVKEADLLEPGEGTFATHKASLR